MCIGFTLGHIRAMSFQDEARRERASLGFKHTIRESCQTQSKISRRNDDLWNFEPPINGAILNINPPYDTRWSVEELDHN